MKLFISWSGNRSQAIANLLYYWLKNIIPDLEPWVSTEDIDRGAIWFSEIIKEISNTSIGIVCLTPENKNKPWILFEAGALAKGLEKNRVCTLLIDLEACDIQDPLAKFNHTTLDKNGLWKLIKTINKHNKKLDESSLKEIFDRHWPQFEIDFSKALESTKPPYQTPSEFINKDGVLRYGTEINISLRDITFLDILKDITDKIPSDDDKKETLKNTGRKLGAGFGREFKVNIHPNQFRNNKPFKDLSNKERLAQWIEYDSSTGWGKIEQRMIKTTIRIKAAHPTLFNKTKEKNFSYFSYLFAGYAESVVNEITKKSKNKNYKLQPIDDNNDEEVSFSLILT